MRCILNNSNDFKRIITFKKQDKSSESRKVWSGILFKKFVKISEMITKKVWLYLGDFILCARIMYLTMLLLLIASILKVPDWVIFIVFLNQPKIKKSYREYMIDRFIPSLIRSA